MKSDKNGCSTCPVGEEQYESFRSTSTGSYYVQYDYRDTDGSLFTTIAIDLETARNSRDRWLENKKKH